MPTYSLLDPFEFPYYFYRIWGELIKVLSIIVCIPSTLATGTIYRITFKTKRHNLQQQRRPYTVVIC